MGFPMTVDRVISRNNLTDAGTLRDDLRRLGEDTPTVVLQQHYPILAGPPLSIVCKCGWGESYETERHTWQDHFVDMLGTGDTP